MVNLYELLISETTTHAISVLSDSVKRPIHPCHHERLY